MSRRRRPKLPAAAVNAHIESLTQDGRGVAHVEGKVCFIQGALPGEEVEFIYSGRRSKFDEGVVQTVLQAAPERVEPSCPHFRICGGCSLQHLASPHQIQLKQTSMLEALHHIGKVSPAEVLPPLRLAHPWGYRRKARLGVKYVPAKGKVLVGFRERSSSFIADLSHCPVLHPAIGERLEDLAALIGGLSVRAHIPQIEVAMGDDPPAETSGSHPPILIFRILQALSQEDQQALLDFGQAQGMQIWTQSGGPHTIQPLAGEASELVYQLPQFNTSIHFRPDDFTQVNYDLNRLMVQRALEMLAPQPHESILDLFCGLGNFTLPIARSGAQVVGVEGDKGLVERARRNAQRNGLDNVRYYTANLYEPLDKEPWLGEKFSQALLDPPRSGAQQVLEHLPRLGVQRILYISCYPATLARDAGELVNRHRYRLTAAGVMDMFPHTAHVESMALFER